METLGVPGFSRAPGASAAVREYSEDLVHVLLASLPNHAARTVGLEIFVHGLLAHLEAALADGDLEGLSGWIERRLGQLSDYQTVRTLTSLATTELAARFAARGTLGSGEILAVQIAVGIVDEAISRAHTRASLAGRSAAPDADLLLEDLIASLDTTDPASAEHSRAVAAWCGRIAKRLGFDRDTVTLVSRGGLIHDVGKIKVPPEILLAPRRLTDEERDIMQSHVTIGDEMLKDYPLLAGFSPFVRWHHERMDGRGYPDKIPAGELPVTVRIVTVADSFNAMIGRRPYRGPFLPTLAIEELIRHRGTQFDPEIVEAMIDVVRNPEPPQLRG
jgi:putative nucleotidyltransferase with HDIG domain